MYLCETGKIKSETKKNRNFLIYISGIIAPILFELVAIESLYKDDTRQVFLNFLQVSSRNILIENTFNIKISDKLKKILISSKRYTVNTIAAKHFLYTWCCYCYRSVYFHRWQKAINRESFKFYSANKGRIIFRYEVQRHLLYFDMHISNAGVSVDIKWQRIYSHI